MLALAVATFALVFGLFVLYAFAAPATYRTKAVVRLDENQNDPEAQRPEPLDLSRRVHESALDRELLERLTRELDPAGPLSARAESARRIRAATAIDTVDGRTYEISFTDSDGERAQRFCNQIARRVAERLPRVLVPEVSAAKAEHEKRAQLLTAFLAAHPGVLEAPRDADPTASDSRSDPTLTALQRERNRVALQLRQAETPVEGSDNSDNPYEVGDSVDPEQLRRRLREIDKTLAARKAALEAPPRKGEVSPEVREQWKALVQSLARAPVEPQRTPAPSARVISRAELPTRPIEPNRPILLLLGAALGLLSGASSAFALRRRGREPSSRREEARPATPPPRTREGGFTVRIEPERPSPEQRPVPVIARAPHALPPAGGTVTVVEVEAEDALSSSDVVPVIAKALPSEERSAPIRPLEVPSGWRPAASLAAGSHRELCGTLSSLALERCFVLGVFAPSDSSDAKSRVAAELALSLADGKHRRVLLLEGNLKRPAVHRMMRLNLAAQDGFSRQLQARFQGTPSPPWTVARCSATLDVLAEGFMRAPGLLITTEFERGMAELRSYYDIVVVDGPLMSDAVDCRALDDLVDGVVLVGADARGAESAAAMFPFGKKRLSTVIRA